MKPGDLVRFRPHGTQAYSLGIFLKSSQVHVESFQTTFPFDRTEPRVKLERVVEIFCTDGRIKISKARVEKILIPNE
jgi:hypothetical protein